MINVTKIISQDTVIESDKERGECVRKAAVQTTFKLSQEQDWYPSLGLPPALLGAH